MLRGKYDYFFSIIKEQCAQVITYSYKIKSLEQLELNFYHFFGDTEVQ